MWRLEHEIDAEVSGLVPSLVRQAASRLAGSHLGGRTNPSGFSSRWDAVHPLLNSGSSIINRVARTLIGRSRMPRTNLLWAGDATPEERSLRCERGLSWALLCVLLAGCATSREHTARQGISEYEQRRPSHEPTQAKAANGLDRGLPGYVAYALAQSPELRASFERWRASVHRISRERRLPEPVLGFGYFVRSIETRVGPQLARVSLQQSFPWPTKLSAGADSASARSQALQRRFDAQALVLTQRVAENYWTLWQIRKTRAIHAEHLHVLRGLSETVRARVMTGAVTLAELQQVDLAASRLEDALQGMDEMERASSARLLAAIGAPRGTETPTPGDPPEVGLPAKSEQVLRASVEEHPLVTSFGLMAEASEASAEREEADAYPSFTLGADWIITGETPMPNVPDSGKDAVIVAAGVRLPLWQGSYGDSASAARADASAERAEGRAARERALAELEASLSAVRDAVRRVNLHRSTLVPQAEAAYESVLGAYATGRAPLALTLLSQRDLLELRIDLESARSDYARSWVRLEQVVGQELQSVPSEGMPPKDESPR